MENLYMENSTIQIGVNTHFVNTKGILFTVEDIVSSIVNNRENIYIIMSMVKMEEVPSISESWESFEQKVSKGEYKIISDVESFYKAKQKHYRHREKVFRVITNGYDYETMEELVVFRYPNSPIIYVRPKKSLTSEFFVCL